MEDSMSVEIEVSSPNSSFLDNQRVILSLANLFTSSQLMKLSSEEIELVKSFNIEAKVAKIQQESVTFEVASLGIYLRLTQSQCSNAVITESRIKSMLLNSIVSTWKNSLDINERNNYCILLRLINKSIRKVTDLSAAACSTDDIFKSFCNLDSSSQSLHSTRSVFYLTGLYDVSEMKQLSAKEQLSIRTYYIDCKIASQETDYVVLQFDIFSMQIRLSREQYNANVTTAMIPGKFYLSNTLFSVLTRTARDSIQRLFRLSPRCCNNITKEHVTSQCAPAASLDHKYKEVFVDKSRQPIASSLDSSVSSTATSTSIAYNKNVPPHVYKPPPGHARLMIERGIQPETSGVLLCLVEEDYTHIEVGQVKKQRMDQLLQLYVGMEVDFAVSSLSVSNKANGNEINNSTVTATITHIASDHILIHISCVNIDLRIPTDCTGIHTQYITSRDYVGNKDRVSDSIVEFMRTDDVERGSDRYTQFRSLFLNSPLCISKDT